MPLSSIFKKTLKTGKILFGKSKKNRTLLALTIENSVLKKDKKTNIIFWERHKSLFLFYGMMTCRVCFQLFSGIFMKSSKLPGMLSVKSKKGLDYMDMILKTTDLCKNFKGQMAVNNVSLNIRRNSVYGLLGPNGAGKSTILKMLTGILRPTSGSIEFDGHPWKRNDLEHIGALIEMPPLYENLTAYENLKVRTTLLSLDDARINEVLQIVQLTNTGKKRAGQFSLGMKQRLGIAIALLNSPQLLILDEPTNGLDPLGIEELRELIRSFPCKGITVILSSHILSEVQQIADHVGIIAGGVLGYEGELRAGEDLEQLFMDVIRRNGKEGY